MRKILLGALAASTALALALVTAGCPQTPPPAPKSVTYKIGAILPLTGPAAVLGEFNKSGMELAADEVNARWTSTGKSLSLSFADSKNDPKEGILAFQKLVAEDTPFLVTAMSSVTNALIQPASENNRLLMATTVSAAGITAGHEKVFRLFIRADTDARTMAEYAAKTLKLKKIAILYVQDDFGASFRDVFKRTFEGGAGKVTAEEAYDRAATDFRAVLTRLKGADFEALYLLGYEKNMGLIPKQMQELGIKKTILSIGTLAQPYVLEQAGDSLNGAYFTATEFDADQPKSETARGFVDRYNAKYGKKPNYFSAFAYDAIRVLAKAMEDAGANRPDPVAGALHKIQGYPGAVGPISVEPNGDAAFPMHVRQIRGGKVQDVKPGA